MQMQMQSSLSFPDMRGSLVGQTAMALRGHIQPVAGVRMFITCTITCA